MPTDRAAAAGEFGAGRVLALARSCHPAPTLLVTAVVLALAAASGRGARGCTVIALATLAGQLSVGWCNDRVDLARDRAAGRRDKPLAAGAVRPGTVSAAAGTALAVCAVLSPAAGVAAGAAHLAGVAAAWAYNLGLKRTVWSPLPYALAFGLLPGFVTLGLPGHPWPPAWAVAAGALLGLGAHGANVLPDIGADLAAGVRGAPQRLGAGRTRVACACALAAASAVLVLGPAGRPGAAGWAALAATGVLSVAAAAAPGGRGAGRTPFLAVQAVAAVDVALLVARGSALH